jgi:hypothetical protein
MLATISACCLDITGLSNQAFSRDATNPFEETFEARPMEIEHLSRFNVIRRSGNKMLESKDWSADRLSATEAK